MIVVLSVWRLPRLPSRKSAGFETKLSLSFKKVFGLHEEPLCNAERRYLRRSGKAKSTLLGTSLVLRAVLFVADLMSKAAHVVAHQTLKEERSGPSLVGAARA